MRQWQRNSWTTEKGLFWKCLVNKYIQTKGWSLKAIFQNSKTQENWSYLVLISCISTRTLMTSHWLKSRCAETLKTELWKSGWYLAWEILYLWLKFNVHILLLSMVKFPPLPASRGWKRCPWIPNSWWVRKQPWKAKAVQTYFCTEHLFSTKDSSYFNP